MSQLNIDKVKRLHAAAAENGWINWQNHLAHFWLKWEIVCKPFSNITVFWVDQNIFNWCSLLNSLIVQNSIGQYELRKGKTRWLRSLNYCGCNSTTIKVLCKLNAETATFNSSLMFSPNWLSAGFKLAFSRVYELTSTGCHTSSKLVIRNLCPYTAYSWQVNFTLPTKLGRLNFYLFVSQGAVTLLT